MNVGSLLDCPENTALFAPGILDRISIVVIEEHGVGNRLLGIELAAVGVAICLVNTVLIRNSFLFLGCIGGFLSSVCLGLIRAGRAASAACQYRCSHRSCHYCTNEFLFHITSL